MKIKELIEILQKYDPEDTVVFEWDASFCLPISYKEYRVERGPIVRTETVVRRDNLGRLIAEDVDHTDENQLYINQEGYKRNFAYEDDDIGVKEGDYLLVIDVSSYGGGFNRNVPCIGEGAIATRKFNGPEIYPPIKREEK